MRFLGTAGRITLLSVKPPSVAGKFYPGEKDALRHTVANFLAAAKPHQPPPKAVIAPHAGYQYSGAIAGTAYASLAGRVAQVRRIILLGPAHHVRLQGFALSSAEVFRTPLGDIPTDRQAWLDARQCPGVQVLDKAFDKEHSLEVQFPFLQQALRNFTMLPILVGDASGEQVAAVLARLWGGPETAIIISSDLSHYLDYASARRLDQQTSKAIEELRAEDITYEQACGRNGIKGLLLQAKQRGLSATTMDLRNSGDTAGDKSRVVGYGAYAIFEPDDSQLTLAERRHLIGIAASSIRHGLNHHRARPISPDDYPGKLSRIQSTFVTLKIAGSLRGCIGSLTATKSLVEDVSSNAFKAAFSDPRFPALGTNEVGALEISLSVLSQPTTLDCDSDEQLISLMRPGIDGLILDDGSRRSTFLPTVWESIPDPREFLRALKRKGGWDEDFWSPQMRVKRYTTESFS